MNTISNSFDIFFEVIIYLFVNVTTLKYLFAFRLETTVKRGPTNEYVITFNNTPVADIDVLKESMKRSVQSPRFRQYLDKAFSSSQELKKENGFSFLAKRDSINKDQSTKPETLQTAEIEGGQISLSRILNKEGKNLLYMIL